MRISTRGNGGWVSRGRSTGVALVLAIVFGHAAAAAEPPASMTAPAGHGGPVRALAVVDGGRRLVSGGFDSLLLVWSLDRASVPRELRHHDSTVNAVVGLADGCFASGGEDGRIAIWCADGTEPVRVLTGHTAPIASLAVTPDGRTLVSAGWDHTVRVWHAFAPAGDQPLTLAIDGHKGPVNGVAVTGDGSTVVSVGFDGAVRMTDLATGAPRRSRVFPSPLTAVAIATDGSIAIAGGDGRVRLLTPDLAVIRDIELDTGPLTSLAITPDGLRIATAGMRTPVTLLDAVTGETMARIVGPGLPVWSLVFADGGRELVSGGADRAIRRWNSATGRPVGADFAAATEAATVADSEQGARLFRACRACHGLTPGETALAGPTLAGIFGRRVGTLPGYSYSPALRQRDIVWDNDTLARLFEIGPNAYLPGTKMPEQRITGAEDRAALFAWLRRVTQ